MSLPLHRVRRKLRWRPFRRPFDPALMLYLPFFEGSGDHVTDESIHGNHGTWTPETWTEGKIGPAPLFDGVDDYVNVFPYSALLYTEATLIAWINLNAIPSETVGVIQHIEVTGFWNSNRIAIGVGRRVYTDWYDGALKLVSGTTVLALNTWHLLASTFKNDDVVRLYVNGQEEGTPTAIGTLVPGWDRVHLGCYGGHTHKFPGVIAEPHIYNRILEPHEILALYRATV